MVILLCPNHHAKFDAGLLTSAELKKIGLTKEQYKRYLPKKRKTSKADEKYYYFWGDGKKPYKSENSLPKSACPSGKHNWESTYIFGTQRCTKCKAIKKAKGIFE